MLGAGLLLLLTRMPASAQNAARVALVIGNGAYPAVAENVNYFRRLTSPVNDANKMAETLLAYGFKVTQLTNASYTEIEQAVNAFVRQLPEGSVGLFFFSGHGVQVQNENYLIPVGRNFADSVDVQEYAVNATWILKKLQNSPAQVKVMLLDACREAMPDLSDDDKEKKGFEGRGLKKMNASGVFIGYAASPGEISLGESGGYGLLTNAFDAAMREFPQLPIEMVFKKAANAVYEATKQRRTPQQPWSEGIIRGEFCFDAENRCLTASATPPPEPTPRIVYIEVTPTPEPRPTIEPTATPTPESTATPTPKPTATPQVEETATPLPLSIPSYPKGNYNVFTTVPILDSQLPPIRVAMKRIGVSLIEQKSAKQPMQAYKVSLGYFPEQQQTAEWGRNYLRPQGIEYKVFNVNDMYSLQLGVFSNQTSVDKKIEQLRQAFPGWRLPIRTELTTIMKPTYRLSARGTTEKVAHSIQKELGRLGIPAELTGK